tara:strand:+ start:536 stop:646 length:111 start_codon:yes stop_codon:yes gene_type:complete
MEEILGKLRKYSNEMRQDLLNFLFIGLLAQINCIGK